MGQGRATSCGSAMAIGGGQGSPAKPPLMRYGSVCSGIEAATVAWHPLGWQAAWYSEIEPFPCGVLKHHYPTVPNYGDMTKYGEWPDEPINLLVGGTPCQSFSVAGLRKGLSDPRGNLMLTFGAIAQRYRPEWLVWENVPGVLSANNGRDFGTFLGMLGELGYGFAYRVLDAQYFGVAQRRRRVFVVGHLGSWQRAAAVLFERDSLSGHPAPSRTAREGTSTFFESSLAQYRAENVGGTLKASGGVLGGGSETFVANTLTTGIGRRNDPDSDTFAVQAMAFPWQSALDPIGNLENLSGTLIKNQTITVAQPMPFGINESAETAHCLRSGASKADKHESTTYVAQLISMRESGQGYWMQDNIAGTLRAEGEDRPSRPSNVIAQPWVGGVDYENNAHTMDEPTGPLLKGSPTGGGRPLPAIANAMQVRRLTPTECERLQGFPDGYTNIPWRKAAESPDGPRYKALGNSMAVPVMRWIGERIAAVNEL